jgi:hypothetical protein
VSADLDRAMVEAVAAALVEPAAGLPGAASIGIAARIKSILTIYPRFAPPVAEALSALADRVPPTIPTSSLADPPAASSPDFPPPADLRAALAALERERPELFTPLLEVVVGAWALSEPVWDALGYEGQRDLDPAAHRIPEDLFQPLLARGPRWTKPPEVTE